MAIDPVLLEQIRNNDPDLAELNLRKECIDDSDACALANALKTNSTVTSLLLWHNSISDAGATALADALKSNRTLTELSFASNSIGEDGAIALANALKGNHTLTSLNLSRNAIGTGGVSALADALKGNYTLTSLFLGHNYIDNAGALALADALKDNHTLRELGLEGNIIEIEGTQALSEALIASKNIFYVNPCTKELKDHYKENEATAMQLMKEIRSDSKNITQDNRKDIQDRIPTILYVGELYFHLSKEQTLKMLASIGIKPTHGPATQKVNAAREAQRLRALEDPSQGI